MTSCEPLESKTSESQKTRSGKHDRTVVWLQLSLFVQTLGNP